MRIEVLLFAQLREAIGESVVMDAAEGATVAEVGAEVLGSRAAGRFSSLPLRYAVDETFVPDDHPLRDGDVVAMIPPVSGG
jgi:molybdopterin synthase sulfur carrier subunit